MKMKLVVLAMGAVMSTVTVAADTTVLKTDMDKLSYSIGSDLGKNFKKQGIDVNPMVMGKGIEDGMKGGPLLLTDQQMKDVLNNFQKNLMAKRTADFNKKAEENKTKGVVTLADGLQYKIITAGTGKKPGKEDTVTVEYKGRLINGDVFDSTEKTGKPATFKLAQVIPGWTEVLQLMPEGSTWEVYIPANLAYGARNVGGPIGPNEVLIFNIHLISIGNTNTANTDSTAKK